MATTPLPSPPERLQAHLDAMAVSHLGRQTHHVIQLAGQVNFLEEQVQGLRQTIQELEQKNRALEVQVQSLMPRTARRRRARTVTERPEPTIHTEARNGG